MKHVLGFSGGVDSQAAAGQLLERYDPIDVILLNSDAGQNEHPLTTAHVNWYSDTIHKIIPTNAIISDIWITENFAERKGLDGSKLLDFGELIRIKGRPPSRKARFCTDILKLQPQKRWMLAAFGVGGQYEGEDYERYTGVRRDESESRKHTPLREWDEFFDCWLNNVIADWSKERCFAYCSARGEIVNPLYLLGFNRVGCAPCGPNANKQDILTWAERFPEMIDKVRDWEKTSGKTFFMPMYKGIHNTVDEVVAWAKTDRGGTQFKILHARPSCESKYGLCE